MDAPDRCPSLNKSSCIAGGVHTWVAQLLERKPVKIATVGLANKTARIAWAVMTRNEVYAAAAA